MFKKISQLGLFVMWMSSLFGQPSTGTSTTVLPREGKVLINLHPVNLGSSLEELVRGSRLIVDGTVSSSLPGVVTNAKDGQPLVETQSIVAVNSILKGTIPNSAATILVTQVGGRSGGLDVSVDGDVLMTQGERYILFLQNDMERKDPPNNSGLTRYAVVGIWAGKAKIADNKVSFLPKTSQNLKKTNDTDANAFIQEIKDRVSEKYIPNQNGNTPSSHPHPSKPLKP